MIFTGDSNDNPNGPTGGGSGDAPTTDDMFPENSEDLGDSNETDSKDVGDGNEDGDSNMGDDEIPQDNGNDAGEEDPEVTEEEQ